LELLKDPLLHLLRNAVDHGIELPSVREQRGKSPQGQVQVTLLQRGGEAQITVQDDGNGFPIEALRQTRPLVADASEDEIIALAFQAGVSTSSQITTISGRGMGLDIVRQQVEALQGRILVTNLPQQGVMIQITVPVSLAMTRVLVVDAGHQLYALPLATVTKIVSPQMIFTVEGRHMMNVDHQPIPVVALSTVLEQSGKQSDEALIIVVTVGEQRVGLWVDQVVTEQELAIKPFSHPLMRIRHLTGAALLGTGEPIVVLNVAEIVKSALGLTTSGITAETPLTELAEPPLPECILVVDDSITTRTLEKNILQAAGYQVLSATDGVEALRELQSANVDLVVADVEMPNMDGIRLTQHLRQTPEFSHLPIILVTSLESREDRERGLLAGANAYIVKRGFNQAELLSTIRQFL
jgi:two-component system, chemotaxis family, sensor kinase CheA